MATNEQNTNGNNGTTVKVPWMIIVTMVTWLVAVVLAFATMESKDHAEKTYLRKDVFEQIAKSNENSLNEIKQKLQSIDEKLDADRNNKKKGN